MVNDPTTLEECETRIWELWWQQRDLEGVLSPEDLDQIDVQIRHLYGVELDLLTPLLKKALKNPEVWDLDWLE